MEQELNRQSRSGHPAWGQPSGSEPARRLDAGRIVTLAGAATSVALILGLGIWGYKLAVRDVRGVPVVRALEGPARIAPEDPGGDFARHTGLAVNAVAAEGVAAAPPEAIALAPAPVALAPDAVPMGALAPAVLLPAGVPPVADAGPVAAPAADIAAPDRASPLPAPVLVPAAVDPVAAFAGTVGAPPDPLDEAPATALLDIAPEIAVTATGVVRSPRPPARPSGLGTRIATATPVPMAAVQTDAAPAPDPVAAAVAAAVAQAIAAPGPARDLDPATLPSGTRLVQLGAFDDVPTARAEWDAVEARFGPLLAGKDRVIEPAESGGRTFYRLRVAGFTDTADARRFCAALLAEGSACIPAQVR